MEWEKVHIYTLPEARNKLAFLVNIGYKWETIAKETKISIPTLKRIYMGFNAREGTIVALCKYWEKINNEKET